MLEIRPLPLFCTPVHSRPTRRHHRLVLLLGERGSPGNRLLWPRHALERVALKQHPTATIARYRCPVEHRIQELQVVDDDPLPVNGMPT